jgi:hypothetical protein
MFNVRARGACAACAEHERGTPNIEPHTEQEHEQRSENPEV